MRSFMRLPMAGALALLAITTTASQVAAQTGGTTGTSEQSLAVDDFRLRIKRKVNGKYEFMSDLEQSLYFGRARCECGANEKVQLYIDLTPSGVSKRSLVLDGTIQIWIGPESCLTSTPASRNLSCFKLSNEIGVNDLLRNTFDARTEIPISALFSFWNDSSKALATDCTQRRQQTIWLWVDANRDSGPDFSNGPSLKVTLDGEPPPAPTNVRIEGGNEALQVSWTPVSAGTSDMDGYLVFCSRGEDLQVFSPSYYSGQYATAATFCGQTTAGALTEAETEGLVPVAQAQTSDADGGAGTGGSGGAGGSGGTGSASVQYYAPAQFRTLDPRFLCHDQLVKSSTGARLEILQNEVNYLVGVAAVDRHGNASSIQTVVMGAPVPTRDFYRAYRMAGGQAAGDCGLAGGVGGRGPRSTGWLLVMLAAAWCWRRLRRPPGC